MLREPPPVPVQEHLPNLTLENPFNGASDQLVEWRKQLKHASERLHMDVLELAEILSRRAASSPHETSPTPKDSLTILRPREIDVLRLIAEGYSTKQIAAELQIAFKTAVCYRTRLLKKLQVHETASLVRVAIRTGLITP